MKFFKRINKYIPFALILIIALGGTLRFYNLNWDNYQIFHPDERNIDAAVTRIQFFSQLNPGFFAYGGLPVYLYRLAGDLINILTRSSVWAYDWGHISLIGRTFSAFFSTLTILAIYFLGKKMFNRKIGIISAFIFAFTVSSIQIAHFATTESFLILIITLLTLLSSAIYKSPKLKFFILLGILFGLGLAAKTTAASFILVPFLLFLLIFLQLKRNTREIIYFSSKLFSFALTGAITFLIFSPYTILSYQKFLESMSYESGVVSGRLPVPYTHQFDKAVPYLFELYNFFWQMGPIFLLSTIGFIILCFLYLKRGNQFYLFVLLFPIIYFLYVGTWHTKFVRYMSILLPFFSIYAAFFIEIIIKKFKKPGVFISIIFLTATFLWAFSYMSVYQKPQTRLLASLWMYRNIKPEDKIYTERWDDGLPIHIEGVQNNLSSDQLIVYDNEFNNKKEYYAEKLSSGNYVILVTRRLYGTLMYLPEQYPTTSIYYKKLFSGELGYKKVAEFSSYPNLFGITINDDSSEESFQVYDHPKVLIFKNVKNYDKDRIWNILKN